MTCLISIVGPTAIGKSKIAIKLAKKFDGEIINADSRQLYRLMDIGTAKPTADDMKAVQHHLINLVNPDESFSLSIYKNLVLRAIEDITSRGRVPFLVGGTGQYVWALLEGWTIPSVIPDPEFRKAMEMKAEKEGSAALYKELEDLDYFAAQNIMPTNVRRIIRALEIIKHSSDTKVPQQKKQPTFKYLIIGLTTDRKLLYKLIDNRVDLMIRSGLVDEVKSLIKKGYSLELPSMSGIGYRQIGKYLNGEISLDDAVNR